MLLPLDEVPVHVHRFAARAPCDSKGSECQCGIHTALSPAKSEDRKSAVGEGTLRCVISSVARNLSERFLGPIENAGPRNDTEILSCIKPGVAPEPWLRRRATALGRAG